MLGQVYVRACVCDMYMSVQVSSTCGGQSTAWGLSLLPQRSLSWNRPLAFLLFSQRGLRNCLFLPPVLGLQAVASISGSLYSFIWDTDSASCLQSKYSYPLSHSPVPIGSPLKGKSTLYSKSNDYSVKEHYLLKDFMLVYEGYLMSFCYLQ